MGSPNVSRPSSASGSSAADNKYFKASADGAEAAKVGIEGAAAAGGGSEAVENATALGNGAKAQASGSIAVGKDSVATEEDELSIGSPGAERRVSNMSDGVNLTDGATVGQLKASKAKSGLGTNVTEEGVVNLVPTKTTSGGLVEFNIGTFTLSKGQNKVYRLSVPGKRFRLTDGGSITGNYDATYDINAQDYSDAYVHVVGFSSPNGVCNNPGGDGGMYPINYNPNYEIYKANNPENPVEPPTAVYGKISGAVVAATDGSGVTPGKPTEAEVMNWEFDWIDLNFSYGWENAVGTWHDMVAMVSLADTIALTPALPRGGTEGQVLTKTGADDFDTEWKDSSGGGGYNMVKVTNASSLRLLPAVDCEYLFPNGVLYGQDMDLPSPNKLVVGDVFRIRLSGVATLGSGESYLSFGNFADDVDYQNMQVCVLGADGLRIETDDKYIELNGVAFDLVAIVSKSSNGNCISITGTLKNIGEETRQLYPSSGGGGSGTTKCYLSSQLAQGSSQLTLPVENCTVIIGDPHDEIIFPDPADHLDDGQSVVVFVTDLPEQILSDRNLVFNGSDGASGYNCLDGNSTFVLSSWSGDKVLSLRATAYNVSGRSGWVLHSAYQ